MIKRIRKIIIWALLIALLMPSFAYASEEKGLAKTGKVGALLGGILDAFCEDAVPGATPEYYYTAADLPMALKAGKIDAYVDDELSAIAHCNVYDNIRIDKVVYADNYGFIFNKKNEELRDKMSRYIIGLRESGELGRLQKIWIEGEDESLKQVNYDDLTGENGTLKIAIAATMPPLIYVNDSGYAGYEVEILTGFCREYGYGVEFSNANFSSVLAGVTSGLYDIGAASISITEERKKSMLFSESHVQAYAVSVVRSEKTVDDYTLDDFKSGRIGVLEGSSNVAAAQGLFPDAVLHYYDSDAEVAKALDSNRIDAYIIDEPYANRVMKAYENQKILTSLEPYECVLVMKDNHGEDTQKSFFGKIKDSFNKTFIQESRWKLFVEGIVTTVLISLASMILGTLVAYILCLIYFKENAIINNTINIIFEIIEKTPAVVILMILYYLVFGKLDVNAAIVATVGLSMKFSIHVFGLFRIGSGAISKGQIEAAKALSYTDSKIFTQIVFPQAVMHIIPGYKSTVVSLIEESAVVGYIAVQDLTKISDIIRSRTYEAFFPLIVSAIIYFCIAVLLIAIIKQVEIKIDPKQRSEEDILKGIDR